MTGRIALFVAALLGGLAVTLGALGAHGLEKVLSPEKLHTFEVAVRYQMYHALALALVGAIGLVRRSACLTAAGWLFLVGVAIFSGLLYAWIFTEVRLFALLVPLGGGAMIAGWICLAVAALRCRPVDQGQ